VTPETGASSSSAAAAPPPASVPQVETVEGASGSIAAGVSLPRRPLSTKRQREELIAEVRVK
jgi:hypothetical protein